MNNEEIGFAGIQFSVSIIGLLLAWSAWSIARLDSKTVEEAVNVLEARRK